MEILRHQRPQCLFAKPGNKDHPQFQPKTLIYEIKREYDTYRKNDLFTQIKAENHYILNQRWALQGKSMYVVTDLYISRHQRPLSLQIDDQYTKKQDANDNHQ